MSIPISQSGTPAPDLEVVVTLEGGEGLEKTELQTLGLDTENAFLTKFCTTCTIISVS